MMIIFIKAEFTVLKQISGRGVFKSHSNSPLDKIKVMHSLLEVEAEKADSCDGCYVGNLTGVNIAGYIIQWKYKKNRSGAYVSLVEPITIQKAQQEIINTLKNSYNRYQINFSATV